MLKYTRIHVYYKSHKSCDFIHPHYDSNQQSFCVNFEQITSYQVYKHFKKTAGKWWKCDPISIHQHRSSRHGLTMNLVDWLRTSADERVLSGRCAVVIQSSSLRDGLLAGVGCSSLTLRFSWTVTLTILGLGFLRACVLRLCCTDGGVLVLQDVGTMKSLHWRCEMWFNCVEWKRSAKLPWSTTAPCTFAAALSFQACLRVFIYTFCMCVCIYGYVCMYADVYICIYMHVCMDLCIYAFMPVCMCMCMHVCA